MLGHIELRKLDFRYENNNRRSGTVMFQSLDWEADLAPGIIIAVLGTSGCGKSTLLRLIAGLESPQSGSVFVDGRDVTRLYPHQRQFALVFQERTLLPGTISSNIEFPMALRRIPKKQRKAKASELARLVGLAEEIDRRIDNLSGGQRQRVELARALAAEPSLCLLDEPLGQLDLPLRRALVREIRLWIKQYGMRAIYVTHDPVEANRVCDLLTTMHNGKLTPARPPHQVYNSPINLSEAMLTGDLNVLSAVVQSVAEDGTLTVRFLSQKGLSGRDLLVIKPEVVLHRGDTITLAFRPLHLPAMPILQPALSVNAEIQETIMRDGFLAVYLDVNVGELSIVAYANPNDTEILPENFLRFDVDATQIMAFAPQGNRLSFSVLRPVAGDPETCSDITFYADEKV